jgi:hypothetical protein
MVRFSALPKSPGRVLSCAADIYNTYIHLQYDLMHSKHTTETSNHKCPAAHPSNIRPKSYCVRTAFKADANQW